VTARGRWLALAAVLGLGGCGSSSLTTGKPDAPVADDGDGPTLDGGDAARAADLGFDAGADMARDAGADVAPDAAAGDASDAPAGGDAGLGPDVPGAPDALDAAADGNGPVTVKLWRHDNPAFIRATDDALAAYMAAHPDVTVAPTTLSWPSYTGGLTADLARDQLAYDLVLMPPSWTCSFAANLDDVPADIASLSEAQNTFFAGPLEGSVCGGKLEALPLEYNLEYGGVVVNLDRYQAKFPGRQPGWASWSSFIAEASALARFDASGKPCSNGLDIDPAWPEPVRHIFLSQILQRGGRYWSASDPRLFDLATPEARDALTAMVGWVTQSKVLFPALFPDKNTFVTFRLAQGAAGYGCNDVYQPLSVMGYVGTWGLASTNSLRPPDVQTHFDYAPLPPMVGTEHKFVQNSGFALAVPKTSKNRRVAWDIIKAIALSPEGMRKWAATAGTLPALRVNGTPAAAASDPLLAKVQPLLERGHWMGYIPAASSEAVLGAMLSNYNAAVRGTKTIDQALKDMQDAANAAIVQHQ
jgi:multiple sugar transport system substrate-binding protein